MESPVEVPTTLSLLLLFVLLLFVLAVMLLLFDLLLPLRLVGKGMHGELRKFLDARQLLQLPGCSTFTLLVRLSTMRFPSVTFNVHIRVF